MRTSTAFFAGAATVVIGMAAGVGGGYLAANIVSPHEQTVSKLERRMSAEPIPVTTAPSQPVPYVAETTAGAMNPPATPAQAQPQTLAQDDQPQTEAAASPAAAAPAEEKATDNSPTVQPASSAPPPSKSAEQANEKTAAPRDAFAKVRDKARDAEVKRAATEKRRAERRQRWEDRRRVRQPRDQELEAVEGRIREITEPRQHIAGEPAWSEMPRIRLFDLD
jgi:hypothetical protein